MGNKALAFVLLGALCAAGLPTNRKDAAVASKGGTDFVPEPDTITGAPPVEVRKHKEFSPAPPVNERKQKEFSPAPPVEERKKKAKKSKEEFIPEPDTITGAPPVEERKKKAKKSKEEFIPDPDTITGAPPVEE